jgi:ATP-dependent DNA ligase
MKTEKTTITLGKFIEPQKPGYATPEEMMAAHGGVTSAEKKYDGYRLQVHKSKDGRFWIFTSSGNSIELQCFPELVVIAKRLPQCIIEAELVADGKSHKEVFDKVKHRFRKSGLSGSALQKYMDSGIISKSPVSIRVFDTLMFEDKKLISEPQQVRRYYTERFDSIRIQPSQMNCISSVEALVSLISETVKNREEGLVCKNPHGLYTPGGRTLDWVKFKRFETLDLVVVGFYPENDHGLPFGSVLCAVYDDDIKKYTTIGKISVIRNKLANEIYPYVQGRMTRNVPGGELFISPKSSKFLPELFINPEDSVVLEVRAMNIEHNDSNWQSCGLALSPDRKSFSLRIAYAMQIRLDKKPRQATSTEQIKKLFELQEAVSA